MKTKSFVGKLDQITKALSSMTPAQREIVHKSIQSLDTVNSTDELITVVAYHFSVVVLTKLFIERFGKIDAGLPNWRRPIF